MAVILGNLAASKNPKGASPSLLPLSLLRAGFFASVLYNKCYESARSSGFLNVTEFFGVCTSSLCGGRTWCWLNNTVLRITNVTKRRWFAATNLS